MTFKRERAVFRRIDVIADRRRRHLVHIGVRLDELRKAIDAIFQDIVIDEHLAIHIGTRPDSDDRDMERLGNLFGH